LAPYRAGRFPSIANRGAACTGECALWQIICIGLLRQEAPLGPRVLIADTDAGLRQRLYGRLLDIDVFSDCVATGPDALQKLEESGYSLVIADVGLPNGGIEQIVAHIGTMRREDRPIVLVLAGAPEAARTLDVEIVQIVLRRPVDINQLIDLVRSCLRSSGAPRREPRDGDSTHVTR